MHLLSAVRKQKYAVNGKCALSCTEICEGAVASFDRVVTFAVDGPLLP